MATPARPTRLSRALVLATSICAIAVTLSAPPAIAQVAAPKTSASQPEIVVDPAQALDQAAQTGVPVPVYGEFTPTTSIYAQPDGTFTADIASGPVRVLDSAGPTGWTPINTTLQQTSAGIQPLATAADITFSDGGSGPAATLELGKQSFSMDWPTPLPTPTLSGDTASYVDVLPKIDLTLRATSTGFEHSFVVKRAPTSPLVLQIPMDLVGLSASTDANGNLILTDNAGHVVGGADRARMWDASLGTSTHSPLHQASIKTIVVKTSTGYALELDPAASFFSDPAVVYPVTIDPTVDLKFLKDTYVDSASPNSVFSSDVNLAVGTPNSGTEVARSLIQFGSSAVSGTHILSATLNLWENWSASCTASTVNIETTTSAWSGPTWNAQPTYGAVYASQSVAKGFSGSCPAANVAFTGGGSGGSTLTTLVQAWADGTITNYGLAVVAASETDSNGWKKFNSTDAGTHVPTLTVNYNSYATIPHVVSPTSGSYVTLTTPRLVARFCDPDGGYGQVDYEVYNNATGALVVSSSTSRGQVQSCINHPWTVPASNLVDATTYKWRARAYDNTDYSAWTSYNTFTVDKTPPTSPTISSSTHPSQTTWYPSTQTSFSASWTASTDATSGVVGYAVAFDNNASFAPTDVTESATTFSTTIANLGIWYLHVVAQDNAGNWSTEADYKIQLGAAMLSPLNNDSTAKYFTLQGQGDPALSTALFQYEKSPTDVWRNIPDGATGDVTTTSGTHITWPVNLDSSGKTPQLVWTVSSTLSGTDGPVLVRVVLGSTAVTSNVVSLALDQNILGASAPLGPGFADLITGNFSLGATDVAIGGLSVSRSLNSRTPAGPAGGIFGPGWISGLESSTPYTILHEDASAGTITIATTASSLFFMKNASGTYTSGAGTDTTLVLVKNTSPTNFVLTETDGTKTTFTQPSGATDYTPSQIQTPASSSTVLNTYQVVSGVAQPTQILDVVPNTITCTTLVKGCRALTFTYASTTTATGTSPSQWGDYVGQVKTISFTGWDPATSQMKTVAVASYLYDSNKLLRAAWDPRISPALKTTQAYDAAGHVITLTPPGQSAWTINYGTITGDTNAGRALSVSRPGVPSGTAKTTISYQVPVSGTGAPHAMDPTSVSGWGQTDIPTDATAIFPPGHNPANPPANYVWATVFYLDRNGAPVNTANSDGSSGGYISTTEYDGFGNVRRTLSPQNRATALATGTTTADHQAEAALLDTQNTYTTDGTELTDSYGPLHTVQLASGAQAQARQHLHITYDEGAPQGGPYYQPTTTTEGALVQGAISDTDLTTTKTGYDWTMLQPKTVTIDPTGLNLMTTTLYDHTTGNVSETRMPANPNGGDAYSTKYFYFTADTTSGDSACNSKPEWAGQLCKATPAAQPTSGNNLPVTTYSYDIWGNPLTKTETVTSPSATRITTYSYDGAGRQQAIAISGPGTSLPTTTLSYDSNSGLPTTSSDGTRTITRHYDALGRLDSYTDADGNASTYAYDLQGRPTSIYDAKGTYTLTYDDGTERRGFLTTEVDSQAGTFTAGYNADGAPTTKTYPNGMTATTTYDETGAPVSLSYLKTSNCSTNCTWLSDQVFPSIHGRWLAQNSSLSAQSYTYDAAGRLTWVYDTTSPGGQGTTSCTTRQYAYDADSNRTSLTSRDPNTDGSCNTTAAGTVTSSTYDQADRATKTGYTFDALGRITAVPAADNSGVGISSTYYANDRANTLTASGATDTVSIDPMNRVRQLATPTATQTWHYAGDGDSPAWIAENAAGTSWTRNVVGPNGQLVANVDQTSSATLLLTNLHGDVAGTASTSGTATSLLSAADQTEFGVPRSSSTARYGWLGGYARAIDPATGTTLMGARVYSSSIGRFTQVDPVVGGSANAYDYAGQDGVNGRDLGGTYNWGCSWTWKGPQCSVWFAKLGTGRIAGANWKAVVYSLISFAVTAWVLKDFPLVGLLAYYGISAGLEEALLLVALVGYMAVIHLEAVYAKRSGRCLRVDVLFNAFAGLLPRPGVAQYSGSYCSGSYG